MSFGVASCPTILSTTYSSFSDDDCCVSSVIEIMVALSLRDVGDCLYSSVVCYFNDAIGIDLSIEIVLRIPFSSMVIGCDNIFMTCCGSCVLNIILI